MKIKHPLAFTCSIIIATSPVLFAEGRAGGGGGDGAGRGQTSSGAARGRMEQHRQYTRSDAREVQQRRTGGDGTGPNWIRDPGVNRRQENQQDRVQQGVKSGQLTKDETQDLRSTQQDIRQEEQEYKSDGTLTKDERVDLHQDLNATSKEIYQEKHDEDVRTTPDPKKLGTKNKQQRKKKSNKKRTSRNNTNKNHNHRK